MSERTAAALQRSVPESDNEGLRSHRSPRAARPSDLGTVQHRFLLGHGKRCSAVLKGHPLGGSWSQKLVTEWSQRPKSASERTPLAPSQEADNGTPVGAAGTKKPAITGSYLRSSNRLIRQGKWWYGCTRIMAFPALSYAVLERSEVRLTVIVTVIHHDLQISVPKRIVIVEDVVVTVCRQGRGQPPWWFRRPAAWLRLRPIPLLKNPLDATAPR